MMNTLFRAVCICALLSLACSVLPVRSQSQSITVTGNDQQVIGGVLSPAPLPATCACTDNTCKPQTVRTSEDIFVAGRPAACDPTTNGMFTLSGLEVRSVSGQNWASTFDKYTATFWSETAQRVRTVYATQTAVDGCLRQSSAPITATVVGVTITCTNSVTSCVLWTNKATNGVIVCKAGTPTPPPTALQAPKPTETTAVVSRTTAANNLEPMAEPTSRCTCSCKYSTSSSGITQSQRMFKTNVPSATCTSSASVCTDTCQAAFTQCSQASSVADAWCTSSAVVTISAGSVPEAMLISAPAMSASNTVATSSALIALVVAALTLLITKPL